MIEALKPFSKAVAATAAGAIVAFLMKHNIVIADGLNDALEIVIAAALTGAVTYFAPKNKPARKR